MGAGGRRVWGSTRGFRHPASARHAGTVRDPSAGWEGRCRELVAKSEGYFAKLPWSRAGGVLRAAGEVGGEGKRAGWGTRERQPAGTV